MVERIQHSLSKRSFFLSLSLLFSLSFSRFISLFFSSHLCSKMLAGWFWVASSASIFLPLRTPALRILHQDNGGDVRRPLAAHCFSANRDRPKRPIRDLAPLLLLLLPPSPSCPSLLDVSAEWSSLRAAPLPNRRLLGTAEETEQTDREMEEKTERNRQRKREMQRQRERE